MSETQGGSAGAAQGGATEDVSRVTTDVLDDAVSRAVEEAVTSPECGAVVTFRGVVRDVDGGRGVTRLDYEAHPDATAVIRRCVAGVAAETGLRVAAVHRPGPSRLTAGPSTVLGTLIGVTAGTFLLAGPGLILGALVGIGFGLLKDNPRD